MADIDERLHAKKNRLRINLLQGSIHYHCAKHIDLFGIVFDRVIVQRKCAMFDVYDMEI